MIIAVTDRKISVRPFMEQIQAIISSRPDMLILREKDLPEEEYELLATECARICDHHGVAFCVNSFVTTAAAIGSGRVQMPFASFADSKDELRFREIWVSVHSLSEASAAETMGATHLIFGNVFETSCKPGVAGKGVSELKRICDSVSIPVFAIGGIGPDTISAAMGAGCEGVCVRSIIMMSRDPKKEIKKLRKKMGAKPPFKV
jgi:thiamine-phosphate pyrophosphorylase